MTTAALDPASLTDAGMEPLSAVFLADPLASDPPVPVIRRDKRGARRPVSQGDLEAARAFLANAAATRLAAYHLSSARVVVVVDEEYDGPSGLPCRVINQVVVIDGASVRAAGTMCLQPNGQWMLVP
jgi:hypothetical protein